jgi:hypothetical protein
MELITGLITDGNEIQFMDIIIKYAFEQSEFDIYSVNNKTFHCYENSLPSYVKTSMKHIKEGTILQRLRGCYLSHTIETIDDMNELYISCIGAKGSDKVFETKHIDGPFYLLPWCKVVRTIVAVQGNSSIITEFPKLSKSMILLRNEFLIFDYNSDIHYIWKDNRIADDTSRIILKLHYIITPSFIPPVVIGFYKWLHVKYNSTMRTLFLNSQENNRLAVFINSGTVWYAFFFQHIGYWNAFMIFSTFIYYSF